MRYVLLISLPVALFILINGTSAKNSQDNESSTDLVWSTASDKCEKKLQDYINECEPSMRAGKKNIVKRGRPTKKTFKSKKKSAKKTKKKKTLNCKKTPRNPTCVMRRVEGNTKSLKTSLSKTSKSVAGMRNYIKDENKKLETRIMSQLEGKLKMLLRPLINETEKVKLQLKQFQWFIEMFNETLSANVSTQSTSAASTMSTQSTATSNASVTFSDVSSSTASNTASTTAKAATTITPTTTISDSASTTTISTANTTATMP